MYIGARTIGVGQAVRKNTHLSGVKKVQEMLPRVAMLVILVQSTENISPISEGHSFTVLQHQIVQHSLIQVARWWDLIAPFELRVI